MLNVFSSDNQAFILRLAFPAWVVQTDPNLARVTWPLLKEFKIASLVQKFCRPDHHNTRPAEGAEQVQDCNCGPGLCEADEGELGRVKTVVALAL